MLPTLMISPNNNRSCLVTISFAFNKIPPAIIFALPSSNPWNNSISEILIQRGVCVVPAAQACVSTTCFGKFSAATRGSVISRMASMPKKIDSFTAGSIVTLRRVNKRSQYSLVICLRSSAEGAEASNTTPPRPLLPSITLKRDSY